MAGNPPIAKKTYVDSADDHRHNAELTYDLFDGVYKELDALKRMHSLQVGACNKEFDKLRSRKLFNRSLSIVAGVIGGIVGYFMSRLGIGP